MLSVRAAVAVIDTFVWGAVYTINVYLSEQHSNNRPHGGEGRRGKSPKHSRLIEIMWMHQNHFIKSVH